jgi:hypothetical protein
MLVHKFYLVGCIQVEFKFELNSNRFEWKQESESVIPSFLSHSFLSLSHSFCSQSSLIFSVIPSFLSHSRSFLSYSFFLGHSPSSTPPLFPFPAGRPPYRCPWPRSAACPEPLRRTRARALASTRASPCF